MTWPAFSTPVARQIAAMADHAEGLSGPNGADLRPLTYAVLLVAERVDALVEVIEAGGHRTQ